MVKTAPSLLLCALAGCGTSPAPPPGAPAGAGPTPAAEAPGSPSPAASSGPSAGAPSTSALPGAPAAPAPASSPAPADAPPAPPPLSPAEQKEMERRCKPLTDAFGKAMRKAARGSELTVLKKLLERPPPKISKPDVETCGALLERSVRGYLTATIEVEAKMVLHRIALSMGTAFERDGKLCPSTERPVPASLDKVATGPYTSTAADWDTPAWKCLQMEELAGQTQRFQYEVRTDAKAQSFEIIARGSPLADGKFVELAQRGRIKPGAGLALEPAARK